VFLWVRNLDRAVDRYSNLMGLEVKQEGCFRHLHLFHLDDGTNLILDSHGKENVPVPERAPVLFKLGTYEMDRAAEEAKDLGFEIVYDIRRLPSKYS
jgi:catechol 2,3-dioxygenase-like lactoylglutathione lyase family enzyme